MRAYLANMEEGVAAAGEMCALFERNIERLDAEIEQLRVRRDYLRLKAEIWGARRDGDEEAERRAVSAVVAVMEVMR